jgi:hypothetical protein
MPGLADLADRIVERRIQYIESLSRKVLGFLTGDLKRDVKTLVTEPLEQAHQNPYFQKLHEQLNGRPITWASLQQLPQIADIQEVRHHSVLIGLQQARACVDNYYRQLLEPLASFPLFYSDPENHLEPNCVGAAQTISVLNQMQGKNKKDLDMLVVLSTSRRDKVLQALRDLDKLPAERFGYGDWVVADVDTFKGGFQKEQFRDLLLDHTLLLEEGSSHIALKAKGGEVLDFDEERTNIKKYDVCKPEEGFFASGLTNLVALYQFLGFPVRSQWQNLRQEVRRTSEGVGAMVDYSVNQDNFPELVEIFGEDLPIRYSVAELSKRDFRQEEVKRVLGKIKEIYAHPRAVQVIAERYLPEQFAFKLAGEKI